MKNEETKTKRPNALKRFLLRLDSISVGGNKERDYLVENMSMLVAGGMTVLAALDAIEGEMRSRGMKRIIAVLREEIENGSPLWRALEKTRAFKDHTISLIRIGEESGKLSQNLQLVADQEEQDRSFRSKIRSAMLYPVFVLVLTFLVGSLIAWFILPRLATVFSQLDAELPTITKWLIAGGQFMGEWGHVALPAAALFLVLLIYFLFYFKPTRFIGQSLLLAFPGVSRLIREVELSRFGYLLGTLLEAGVPVTQALNSLSQAATFPHYRRLYEHLRDRIGEGYSFQSSFKSYKKSKKLVPVPIQQLIVVAEQSGNLSPTLLKISENYAAKTEDTTKNLTVILEPILLVVVWLGVLAVAVAVILPIYSLVGGLDANNQSVEATQLPAEAIPAPPVVEPEPPEEVVVTTLRVVDDEGGPINVRDDSSAQGDVVKQVTSGEEFPYVDESDGWYEIVFACGLDDIACSDDGENTGWIFGDFVELLNSDQSDEV